MLLNNTSSYPTKEVAAIVKFAAGNIFIGNIAINVKRSRTRAYRGRAYRSVPYQSPWHATKRIGLLKRIGLTPQARYLVTCGIGDPHWYPYHAPKRGAYFEWFLETWQENLVHLIAHELMHCQQYRASAPASEPECERYAVERLEQWRKRNAE